MDPERETLRNQVYKAHSRYVPVHPNLRSSVFKPVCPWCEKLITDPWHAHEVLVKRNAVPVEKQHLIFVSENILPVHERCHTDHGQIAEMRQKGLKMLCENLTAENVGLWYTSLFIKHSLDIPKGILPPRANLPISSALNYLIVGLHLRGFEPSDDQADDELVSLAIRRYGGHKVPAGTGKRETHGINFQILLDALEEGRWYSYLQGVCV